MSWDKKFKQKMQYRQERITKIWVHISACCIILAFFFCSIECVSLCFCVYAGPKFFFLHKGLQKKIRKLFLDQRASEINLEYIFESKNPQKKIEKKNFKMKSVS